MSISRSYLLACAAGLCLHGGVTLAANVAFQDPASASWGNWTRGSSGTLYVHWDRFRNEPNIGVSPVLPDTTPDVAAHGLAASGALLITGKKNSNATPAAFITGSGNIYSFADILDFDVIVNANAAHTKLGMTPVTVALQLSVLGTDIDHGSVKLLGQSFDSRRTLNTGAASGPGGTGTGVDNEYLYLWQLPFASAVYVFEFAARDTSLSLDAIAIDIGPAARNSSGGMGGGGTGGSAPGSAAD